MPWFIGLQLCFYCSGGKRLAAVFQHSKCCLIALSFSSPVLCFICFFLPSFNPSIHSLSTLCSASLHLSSSIFFSGAAISSLQIHTLSSIRFRSVNFSLLEYLSSSLSSSNRFLFSIFCPPWSPHSLCFCAQSSNSHLSMSLWLPTLNLFPCHSPGQGHPPVSSIGGHEEKLARRSDNLLTPHLSSERGKAPS